MAKPETQRLDELPLDRRIAGKWTKSSVTRATKMSAIYERRDIDPISPHFKRRTGSVRVSSVQPNLLGARTGDNKGSIVIDRDFTTEIAVNNNWTMFFSVRVNTISETAERWTRLVSFDGTRTYMRRLHDGIAGHVVQFRVYSAAGALIVQTAELTIEGVYGGDFHVVVKRASGDAVVNAHYAQSPDAWPSNVAFRHTFVVEGELSLFGVNTAALSPANTEVVLANVMVYNNDVFVTTDYDTYASDLTPPGTASPAGGTATLLWHNTLSDGGSVLSHTNTASADVSAYLRPTPPEAYSSDAAVDPTDIRFGGEGVIEVPFYLDFDEYFWTTTNAAARLDWCFQLELTTPAILAVGTVFELQDLVRVTIVAGFKLQATFNDGGTVVLNSVVLAGATAYDCFIARNETNCYVKVGTTEVSGGPSDPIIYEYDKTIGFIIGDRVDFENAEPFHGRIGRFALHNVADRSFQTKATAVMYYDVDSLQGDEVIDQGNRSLNSYVGTRTAAQAPYYAEGPMTGGSYVAATGGYLVSSAAPDIGYTGQLSKPLTKDAVVQRRGERAFLTSGGVSYIVDDRTKSIRPLGIPRPSTKVSCTPQGVGPIDGFVRYAYRYVTNDGTVGPIFQLDPCDAQGGVNVFLGAETFSTPSDPVFGLTFGEAEAGLVSAEAVECFIAHDDDNSGSYVPLLHREIRNPGLTLETAFRLPDIENLSKESVISQGVHAPNGPGRWMARNAPKEFPWIGNSFQECCFQFTFRYVAGGNPQVLFCIGAEAQRYQTGSGWTGHHTHWRLHHLVVSIQSALNNSAPESNTSSIVVTRDEPGGSNHRDDDLYHSALDYNFRDGEDYTIFISRCGILHGYQPGSALSIAIFNHTLHQPDGTGINGWKLWPHDANASQVVWQNYYGLNYAGSARNKIMWGACRKQGNNLSGRTRYRTAAGSTSFGFGHVNAFYNGTAVDGTGGQRMYHGRMWRKDIPLTLLQVRALERYGARSGPLHNLLEVDVAFCGDSSQTRLWGGWDAKADVRVKYHAPSEIEAFTVLTDTTTETTFLGYGFDNTITAGSPNTHAVTDTSRIPLWAKYSSRDEGSIVIGTGRYSAVSIAQKKWHDSSEVQTFDEFANTIDLREWTWITLYFHQILRVDNTDTFDVWLERVFIDGNTGDWGNVFSGDASNDLLGPGGMSKNLTAGDGQYTLFTLGGVPGIDTGYEIEIAELRLWDGERYTSQGGGEGLETFGPYMSTRVPPNLWNKLWYYIRFAPLDVDDVELQTTIDQKGSFKETGGTPQASANAVDIYQGAEVKTGGDVGGSGGSAYFIPFPTPPIPAIRGIQLFRSQITPVSEDYPNGEPNPNAKTDAFKACRAAPLYYLSEIPDGTNFYFDSAIDTTLGAQLDLTEGLIPGNPGGVFEWGGFIGVWVTDIPRIHFAASPDSWESFPTDMILDMPLREHGTIQAATELASRDARQSRVLVLGQSWGVFLDGSPVSPRVNTLGGGVGAASSRCLVVEKGIAYAYNGTLWAISGDGQVEDIGLPVLGLLPNPAEARLSVSSSLSSLFVINEATGLALRWHFARREWFVEDRYALSTTDIDGDAHWIHVSGYPSKANDTVYADDVELDTPTSLVVASYSNAANTLTFGAVTGLKVGQHITVVADQDPRYRQTVTIASISGLVVTVTEDLDLAVTSPGGVGDTTITLTYNARVGIGYWGTMLDTGQFINEGLLHHTDLGITAGDRWYGMSVGADFAGDPDDRSRFDAAESFPTRFDDGSGTGQAARWGLTARQRIQRLLFWSFEPTSVGLSELELNYTND
jgi:hypothetical protein